MLERKNTRAYNMIFDGVELELDSSGNERIGKEYWLASKSIGVHDNYNNTLKIAEFSLGVVLLYENVYRTGNCYYMFDSAWGPTGTASEVESAFYGVRPVVILKPEITTDAVQKIQDKKEEEWNYILSFEQ